MHAHSASTKKNHRHPLTSVSCGVLLATTLALGACSSINDLLSTDKVDYKAGGAQLPKPLDVPPDLTQLNNDARLQNNSDGSISASGLAAQAANAASAPSTSNEVAVDKAGEVQLLRSGNMRWIHTKQSPDTVWPAVKAYWESQGFTLAQEDAQRGMMQTNWKEDRAKLPDDLLRRTLGKIIDNVYDTGERDQYITRVERGDGGGSDIFISHRGLIDSIDRTHDIDNGWQARPSDPLLEADMLQGLLLQLGGVAPAGVNTATASASDKDKSKPSVPATPVNNRALMLSNVPGTQFQVNDDLETAWRRVGLALDRGSFTVEDRDRGQNTFFVRYIDAALAEKGSPSFIARLFGAKDESVKSMERFRLVLSESGGTSKVSILNNQGEPDNSDNAKHLAKLLVDNINQ